MAWPVIRQVLGWFFIFLGVLGLLLPVLQGVFTVLASAVVLMNLLAELLYRVLDPRVRTS